MSLKVPNAYRLLHDNLWLVLWWIEDEAKLRATARLREHYEELVIEMEPELAAYKAAREKDPGLSEALFRLHRARDHVRDGYQKQLGQLHFDTYSLDVSVGIYPCAGNFYLRTFAEPGSIFGGLLDFVAEHASLEDFSYTSQIDAPRGITEEAWEHRAVVWNEIYPNRPARPRTLALDIVTWHTFVDVDPWLDMAREWHEHGFELPIREEVFARRLRKKKMLEGVAVTAGDGFIDASPIMSAKRLADDKHWASCVHDRGFVHETLNQAGERLDFESNDASLRRMAISLMQRHGAKLPPWLEPAPATPG